MTDDYIHVSVIGPPQLTEARLYDETLEHIAQSHAEFQLQLPSQQTALVDAVANPTALYDSTTAPGKSVVLVSESFTHLDDPVHVAVKLVEGTSGRVQTAYFSSRTPGGRLLWSAGDE
jgi:hypothetical protein